MFRITRDPSSESFISAWLKITLLIIIKYLKIFKIAPTCFESQGIHHQRALYSAWLKITVLIYSSTTHSV